MTSSTPRSVEELQGVKIEKILLDGDTLSSSLPHLEMSSSTVSHGSPREREGTSDAINYHARKSPSIKREGSAKSSTRSPACKPSSSIPLPVKSPKSSSSAKTIGHSLPRSFSSKLSKPSSSMLGATQITNKHTLEIQFLNKKKRLALLQKDLAEKQKPVLDLYQNLIQIKKRLEELGKIVYLEEMKLLPYNEQRQNVELGDGAGESTSPEIILEMQTSMEQIPRTLMEICKNLLGRRNVIVDLLESIVKSEVDVSDLTDQIEALKTEGAQLQSNLDVVIKEHHSKIKEVVKNWQSLINDKKSVNTNTKISDLEDRLKFQEKLTEDSNQLIQELQRKLDDKRSGHDRYVAELNNVIHGLKDQMQKLEQELEYERKSATDYKNRNNTNAQNSKMLRNKIAELENERKSAEALNTELNRKVRLLQDQAKHKEAQWNKEKEELTRNLKHQENMLQKLTADKSTFETRLAEAKEQRFFTEETLQKNLDEVRKELEDTKEALEKMTVEKNEVTEKCKEMEDHLARMGLENKETMDMVSNSIVWGKDATCVSAKANEYSESMMKDIIIQEFKDKIRRLEEENNLHKETIALVESNKNKVPTETEKNVMLQHDVVLRYKQLLFESEQKLSEKSQEVGKLTSEIRQLKVRQEHLEELNQKCPTENLQKMVEEGRAKLTELMRKSLESEQKILHCENVIEKQSKQINEMENLLRYRENMAGVLKASRDELVIEKESLTRYSQEMRTVLAEVTKEGKMKDRLIKELQEKIDLRERQINKLEKEVRELETNLVMTNEKRFKLQETIGSMEKELQSTKAHVNQLADINTRYELDFDVPIERTQRQKKLLPKVKRNKEQTTKAIHF
ncbi:uncharacterized protein isoform X2 [Leptinotarsa decemlineata]|uniref:uncharacterized protein isoform X2 n=1 Tax=Leptinotarsa decemlineata TaxID=7539 RepID=UPI003D309278